MRSELPRRGFLIAFWARFVDSDWVHLQFALRIALEIFLSNLKKIDCKKSGRIHSNLRRRIHACLQRVTKCARSAERDARVFFALNKPKGRRETNRNNIYGNLIPKLLLPKWREMLTILFAPKHIVGETCELHISIYIYIYIYYTIKHI